MKNRDKPINPITDYPLFEQTNGQLLKTNRLDVEHVYNGLTKREYFALHILSGICSFESNPLDTMSKPKRAVQLADLLLDELEKDENQ